MYILPITSNPATNTSTNSAAVAVATASALFENFLFSVVCADN
jgi:hypothetical protein